MRREEQLQKNTFILALGNFLPKLVSIVTLPIVTACLTKSEYGTYDLISTMVMLLIPIATLQIQSSAFRFLIDCRSDQQKSASVITNILIVIFPASFIVSIGIILFWPNMIIGVKALIGVYFFLDAIQSTVGQVARGLGMNRVYSAASVILSVINGIGIILALSIKNTGLIGVIASLVVANIVAILYQIAMIKIWRYIRLSKIALNVIKKLLKYSWPMVPNNLSSWVLRLSDRLIITAVLGVEANAIYAVANKIPNLLSIAQSVMVMAWQENASLAVKDKDASEYYSKMFIRIFSLMIGCTALLIGFMPMIFRLLIRGDYDASYIQMPILILGMFFYCMSSFQGGIYIAHKKTTSVGITTIIAAGVNLFVNLLLVKFIGITASSLSTLTAYLFLYIFRQIDIQKYQKIDFHIKKQVCYIFIIIVMLILCYMRIFWGDTINILLGIVVFIILNNSIFKWIILKVFQR